MKKFKQNLFNLALFTMIAAVTTPGCKKDDDNDSSPSVNNGSISAVVDGIAWNATAASVAAARMNGTTNITGRASDSSLITITITEEVNVGVYDLGIGGDGAGVFTVTIMGNTTTWTSNASVQGGTFTVTSIDTVNKKMTGTFEYSAYNGVDDSTRTITTGVFTNVKYATTITNTGNNSFSCKIDGVTFTPAILSGASNFGTIIISASDNTGNKSVGLNMPDNIAAGTYALDGTTPAGGQYNPNSSTFLMAVSGSLVISSHNTTTKKIVGTFNFVAEPFGGPPPSNNITNGSFTIFY